MTSDRIDELRKAWSTLGAQPPSSQMAAYLVDESGREICASLTPNGFRGLLVGLGPVERVIVPRDLSPGESIALVASVAHFKGSDAPASRYLHVWCQDHQADQAFEAFCALLWGSVDDGDVGLSLKKCTNEFRRLLAAKQGLVEKSAVGVLGELLFLNRLIEASPELTSAWTGPTHARHDFRVGSAAVEIKTTLRSDVRNRRVRISDIDQLEPPQSGSLYLHLIRLEHAAKGSISLRKVVEEIEGKLDVESVAMFRELIRPFELDANWDNGFELREHCTYAVTEGFPSLTRPKLSSGELDVGVSRVCYDLSLENATSFEAPISAAIQSLIDQLHA